MTTILVIDDDVEFCETMESLIRRMDMTCLTAQLLESGLAILNTTPVDIVLLDVRLPDGNGLEALPRIKKAPGDPEVIILTGQGDPDGAELAIQGGVWDYLLKPASIKQTRFSLTRALRYREEKRAEAPVRLDLNQIIGKSAALQHCYDVVAKAAVSNSQVLITGETGTGKELFARTIHENSRRSNKNFVVVDCASLTETLLESTLFGHKKGAFTGADTDRVGLVKVADGGTLFLDEVGDMPLSIQKSFLRVLQEKRFRPLGQSGELTSDFRLIAATHRNIEEMAERGTFRQDLMFRLLTIHLPLPPLRERTGDIRELALFFMEKACRENNLPPKVLDPDFLEVLTSHSWPGNVRELSNVIDMAVIGAGSKGTIYAMDLPRSLRIKVAKASFSQSTTAGDTESAHGQVMEILKETGAKIVRDFGHEIPDIKTMKGLLEEAYLENLIHHTRGNSKKIREMAGLSKSHFYSLLKKKNISITD